MLAGSAAAAPGTLTGGVGNDRFNVYVPDAQFDSSGTTWANGQTPGHSIPIEDFFIAKPTDSVQTINYALSRGMNLIFTPGVYDMDKTIKIKRADTVVLGLGMATLTAQNGVVPMTVADVEGVERSPGSSSTPAQSTRRSCYRLALRKRTPAGL